MFAKLLVWNTVSPKVNTKNKYPKAVLCKGKFEKGDYGPVELRQTKPAAPGKEKGYPSEYTRKKLTQLLETLSGKILNKFNLLTNNICYCGDDGLAGKIAGMIDYFNKNSDFIFIQNIITGVNQKSLFVNVYNSQKLAFQKALIIDHLDGYDSVRTLDVQIGVRFDKDKIIGLLDIKYNMDLNATVRNIKIKRMFRNEKALKKIILPLINKLLFYYDEREDKPRFLPEAKLKNVYLIRKFIMELNKFNYFFS